MTWRSLREEGAESLQPLGRSLEEIAAKLGVGTPKRTGAVLSSWEGVVGPTIGRHARPVTITDEVLVVVVDSPAWATEMRISGRQLLEALERETGMPMPRRLVVQLEPPVHASGERGGKGGRV